MPIYAIIAILLLFNHKIKIRVLFAPPPPQHILTNKKRKEVFLSYLESGFGGGGGFAKHTDANDSKKHTQSTNKSKMKNGMKI